MHPKSPSLIVCDVGGTVLMTDDLHLAAWRAALLELGIDHEPYLSAVERAFANGMDSFSTARSLRISARAAETLASRKRELAQVVRRVDVNADVIEWIDSRGVTACAISHSDQEWTRNMLEAAGVYDRFSLVLGRTSDESVQKSTLLQMCVDTFPVDRLGGAYIGNTPTDRALADEFGFRFVSVQLLREEASGSQTMDSSSGPA